MAQVCELVLEMLTPKGGLLNPSNSETNSRGRAESGANAKAEASPLHGKNGNR